MQLLLHVARLTLLLVLSLTAGALRVSRPEPASILPASPGAEALQPHEEIRSVSSMGPESSESCDPSTDREILNGWLYAGGWTQPDRSEPIDFYPRPFLPELLAGASSARSPPKVFLD